MKDWIYSWWCHFQLANLISDWYRSEFNLQMKSKGIKPRRTPLPPRLHLLPCNLMVLSAVMLTMHAVAMAGAAPVPCPPVTWVVAVGGVRGLLPPTIPPKRLPPDPVSTLPLDGEGGKPAVASNVNQVPEPFESVQDVGNGHTVESVEDKPDSLQDEGTHSVDKSETVSVEDDGNDCCEHKPVQGDDASNFESVEDIDDEGGWDSFKMTTNCCFKLLNAMENYSNLHEHVLLCNTGSVPSFGPLGLLATGEQNVEAIVDTGASLTITPFLSDFITYEKQTGLVVNGLSKGATVAGIGMIEWLVEIGDKTVSLKLSALHVPEAGRRLLSPQQLRKETFPGMPEWRIGDYAVSLDLPQGTVECRYNESNLPALVLSTPKETAAEINGLNACLTLEQNQNLTASQKELLKWHTKLGHCGLKRVQQLMKTGALGHSPWIKAASNVDFQKLPLICGSCAFGKAKRRAKKTRTDGGLHPPQPPEVEKLLSKEVLIPGQKVSMDHFIVSTPGRLFNSRGRESHDRMYKGGVIFVDNATSFVHVVPVVNFTAGEALRAKREFESEMDSMGNCSSIPH